MLFIRITLFCSSLSCEPAGAPGELSFTVSTSRKLWPPAQLSPEEIGGRWSNTNSSSGAQEALSSLPSLPHCSPLRPSVYVPWNVNPHTPHTPHLEYKTLVSHPGGCSGQTRAREAPKARHQPGTRSASLLGARVSRMVIAHQHRHQSACSRQKRTRHDNMIIILTRAQCNALQGLTSNLANEIINVYAVLNSSDMTRFPQGFGRALEFIEKTPHRKMELLARLHRPTSVQSVTRFVTTIHKRRIAWQPSRRPRPVVVGHRHRRPERWLLLVRRRR